MQKNEYVTAVKQLQDWDRAYHQRDAPEVSDAEYDALFHKVLGVEQEHPDWVLDSSPTQRVGAKPLDKFEKYQHEYRLFSLSNAYSEGELKEFESRVAKYLPPDADYEYFGETKFDGLSMALYYRDSRFQMAVTRGDGQTGEVVTQNVKTIRSVPLTISDSRPLVLRAEVVLPRQEFERVNRRQEEEGLAPFANPRNAAAGTIRQLNPAIAASRRLDCYVYDVLNRDALDFQTHADAMQHLQTLGFQIDPRGRLLKTHQEMMYFYEEVLGQRHDLAYDIDGIVLKLNSFYLQELCGTTAKSPRYSIAFKYAPEQARAYIKDIQIQVGRTGVLTPVAVFEPVSLAGSTIQHASLHNWDEIQAKDIRIGDWAWIEKAGDIIPQVVRVEQDRRQSELEPFLRPSACPVCHTSVIQKEGEIAWRCPSEECPSRLLNALKHFVSRDALNIQGIGESVLSQLLNAGLLSCPWDLFGLSKDDFLCLKETREKLATKLHVAVHETLPLDLARVLHGLGLPHVGAQSARLLANHFKSYQAVLSADKEQFAEIEGFGDIMASAIHDRLHSDVFVRWEERRRELSVQIQDVQAPDVLSGGPLDGQVVCFTGKLYRMGRSQAQARARELGASTTDSVTRETTLLVVGEKAGSKLKRAEKLQIRVLSEEQFLDQYDQGESHE